MKTQKPKTDTKARSDLVIVITISLSRELLDKVNAAAAAENRSRSNWIAHTLTQLLSQK